MAVLKWLDKHFEESVMSVFLILMTLIMGMQVFSRYALNASLTWSEEITRYLFVWCGFMSIALCIRFGLGLSVDQAVHLAPPKIGLGIKLFALTAQLMLFAWLTPGAYRFVHLAFSSGRLSPAAQIPIWVLQSAPVTGFSLAVIRCVQRIIITVREESRGSP